MKPFRERNPVPIGAAGLIALAAMGYGAFNAQNLSILGGGGKSYHAAFAEAGDLKSDDEVRIAGVSVGKVTGVDLEGAHVKVTFRLKPGTFIGDQSGAAIKLRTVVGARYLEVDPKGDTPLSPRTEIPESRTLPPFSIVTTLNTLSGQLDQIDTTQLAKSFDTLSKTFQNSPQVSLQALTGLSRLSKTITSRDQDIKSLLTHTQSVAKTVADRDEQITAILSDSDLVLQVLDQRREVINDVLVHTSQLANEITGLAREDRATLAPALAKLKTVLAVLEKNRDNIDRTVQELAPFSRDFSNVLGSGHWFDVFISNLTSPNLDPSTLLNGLLGTTVTP